MIRTNYFKKVIHRVLNRFVIVKSYPQIVENWWITLK